MDTVKGLKDVVFDAATAVTEALDRLGLAPADGDETLRISKLFHLYLDHLQGNLTNEEYERLLEKIEKEATVCT